MKILVTGSTGYIGSHTTVFLLKSGHDVVLLDNLSNSKVQVLDRIKTIANKKDIPFYKVEMCDLSSLESVFMSHSFDSVIHFAGLKAVGESVENPIYYYENNLLSTINLCKMVQKYKTKSIIFSSSATVYGSPKKVPITEEADLSPTNPYGRTKYFIEEILKDFQRKNNEKSIVILRYFNPVGAHSSGLIGEDPRGTPNNLMPFITQVAVGKRQKLQVFGGDYETPDGTGIRDYIHVEDLANGHVLSLKKTSDPGVHIYNLGTGKGYSVLEIVSNFESENNIKIPYEIVERRPGDVPQIFADCSKAEKEIGFQATKTLKDMVRDAYNWQINNPNGFE